MNIHPYQPNILSRRIMFMLCVFVCTWLATYYKSKKSRTQVSICNYKLNVTKRARDVIFLMF